MRTYWDVSDRTLLLERVRRVNADSHRRWGKMTHQMICHVADAFRAALREIEVTPRGGLEWMVRWPALYFPMSWPHGYPAPRELDQLRGYGTVPVEFLRDRDDLLIVMERFAPEAVRSSRHPLWGDDRVGVGLLTYRSSPAAIRSVAARLASVILSCWFGRMQQAQAMECSSV